MLGVCGVSVALIFLEILLGILGFWYVKNRDPISHSTNEDRSLYRIVALGESTTAPLNGPAWPELLEQELNKRAGERRFRVYNFGVAGSNSSGIVNRLYEEVMPLGPDMVITMMGINDIKYLALPTVEHTVIDANLHKLKDLRITKLLAVLSQMIIRRQYRHLIEKAIHCTGDEGIGDYDWTREYLPRYQSIIDTIYPYNYSGQFFDGPSDKKAEEVLLEFLDRYSFSYQAYEVLVDHYATRSLWERVSYWTKKARGLEPFIRLCIRTNPTIAVQAKEAMLRHLTDIEILMESMHVVSKKIMTQRVNQEKAFYQQIRVALEVDSRSANVNTSRSYETLARYLGEHSIAHIAIQYPLLPVDELRSMLRDVSGVTYVSNEENFQTALQTHTYSDLFIDNFAGVFGHTTPLGSQLIASAAADAVLQIAPIEY